MDTIPQLPQDVVENILARLPVKHLTQLKRVCKTWLSLISGPNFAKLQLAQSKKNGRSRILCFSDPLQTVGCEDSDVDHDLDHVFHLEYPAIMRWTPEFDFPGLRGSCNGLICVELLDRCIFLWNPTIREAMELANDGNFDPGNYFICGLGYDFSIDDYKILRVRLCLQADGDFLANDFEILALKSKEWCKVQEPTVDYIFVELKAGIFLHERLHWIVKRPSDILVVLVLDMAEEKFYELVELPDSTQESEHDWLGLVSSGDSLFLFSKLSDSSLEAWKLNDYGFKSSWTKIFSNKSCIPEFGYWGSLLHCTKTGKFVVDYGSRGLVWYDPKENTWEIVTLQEDLEVLQHAIYVESLILPDWYRPNNA